MRLALILGFLGLLFSCVSAQNFYEILGVANDADEGTIKRSYRKLSLKYHPGMLWKNSKARVFFFPFLRGLFWIFLLNYVPHLFSRPSLASSSMPPLLHIDTDKNPGDEEAARQFTQVARAYEVSILLFVLLFCCTSFF